MNRRAFLAAAAGGLIAMPAAARAQQADKIVASATCPCNPA